MDEQKTTVLKNNIANIDELMGKAGFELYFQLGMVAEIARAVSEGKPIQEASARSLVQTARQMMDKYGNGETAAKALTELFGFFEETLRDYLK